MSAVTTYTSSMILTNVGRMLDQQIRNEAELRFCIGDPLLCSICDTWKYKAKLEESVKNQTSQHTTSQSEPQSAVTSQTPRGWKLHDDVITTQSRADYTVYVVRDKSESIISVVIETKHASNTKINHVLLDILQHLRLR